MKTIRKVIFLLGVLLVVCSYATIQPMRVGPVSQYGFLQAGKNSAGEGRIYGSVELFLLGERLVQI